MKLPKIQHSILGLTASALLLCASAQASNPDVMEIDGREFLRVDDMLIPYESSAKNEFSINKVDSTVSSWTNGKVYYTFDSQVTQENRQNFLEAAQVWADIADLEFIERTNEPNFIFVKNDNSNYATVGMVGGQQVLAMVNWGSKYVIVHELGHSLGFWHEQQRSDRDNYVTIALDNVDSNNHHNFNTRTTTNYAPYDFMSVMHYNLIAFSNNQQRTIVPLPKYEPIAQAAGQRRNISGGDQIAAASVYGTKLIPIEDAALRNHLITNTDSNNDGVIDSIEASDVSSLFLPGNGTISSLNGLEHFRSLSQLIASNENLSELPNLPLRIQNIDISNNQFESLNFYWHSNPILSSVDISGNYLDVYDCVDILAIQDKVSLHSFTFNPQADGSTLVCDEQSLFTLINDKPRLDLRNKDTATYFIDVPAGQDTLTINTSHHNGETGGLMDVYVAFNREPTSSDYDYISNQPENIESVTVNTPAAGRWYISLVPNDRSFESVDLVATYSQIGGGQTQLVKGTPATSISGQQYETVSFFMDVPQGATDLSFTMSGGTGDADLYVQFGAEPTSTEFDCRPWLAGNNEQCTISNVQAGRYYVNVVGYNNFDSLTLIGDYTAPIAGGELTESNLTGTATSWQYFTIEVPTGMQSLNVLTTGGTGDVDLYLKRGAQPSNSDYDCRPYRYGNEESCEIASPAAGTWHIGVRGYSNYNGVTLQAVWQ